MKRARAVVSFDVVCSSEDRPAVTPDGQSQPRTSVRCRPRSVGPSRAACGGCLDESNRSDHQSMSCILNELDAGMNGGVIFTGMPVVASETRWMPGYVREM